MYVRKFTTITRFFRDYKKSEHEVPADKNNKDEFSFPELLNKEIEVPKYNFKRKFDL